MTGALVSERLWKKAERVIARRLGGERIPVTGRAGRPDVAHPLLAVEVKTRRTLPRWLLEALAQASRAAGPGQVGVVVLHRVGAPHARDLVLLWLGDFERLLHREGATDRTGDSR